MVLRGFVLFVSSPHLAHEKFQKHDGGQVAQSGGRRVSASQESDGALGAEDDTCGGSNPCG
ncbi:hypothetical protein NHF46_22620 [Arthrobacter alpinus]|nr:hypothetical protein [Arthrobacter alpinus]